MVFMKACHGQALEISWQRKRRGLATASFFFPLGGNMVGTARFELATPCTQNRCATRLRYAPTCEAGFTPTVRE